MNPIHGESLSLSFSLVAFIARNGWKRNMVDSWKIIGGVVLGVAGVVVFEFSTCGGFGIPMSGTCTNISGGQTIGESSALIGLILLLWSIFPRRLAKS